MSQTLDHEQELARLSEMMRDPRYWRHKHPALVAKMTEGFQRLFNPSAALQRAELGQAANIAGATGPTQARDVLIGHLAPGEIVVAPRAQNPAVLDALQAELGDEIGRFTMGSGLERRNPVSGLPAFAPDNEEDDSNDGSWWIDLLTGFLGNAAKRSGGTLSGFADPDDTGDAKGSLDFLDQLGTRDEIPPDTQSRKCSPLERRDPLSPCLVWPTE